MRHIAFVLLLTWIVFLLETQKKAYFKYLNRICLADSGILKKTS